MKPRRLFKSKDNKISSLKRLAAEKLGAKMADAPDAKSPEWEKFEDLYFELKKITRYRPELNEIGNSLGDLAVGIWNFQRQTDEDTMAFVTANVSILQARDKIKEKYGVEVWTKQQMMQHAAKEWEKKQKESQ